MIDTENMKQTRVKKDTGIFIGKGNKETIIMNFMNKS